MDIKNIMIYIDDNHRTYASLSNGLFHVTLPNRQTFTYNLEGFQNKLQAYIEKYDINKYNGEIVLYKEDWITYIFYRQTLIAYHEDVHQIEEYRDQLSAIRSMLLSLLNKEVELNKLSFEIKEKNLFHQIQEFNRCFHLEPDKTNQWLKHNVTVINQNFDHLTSITYIESL